MAAALVLKALSVASALVAASAGQVSTALRQTRAGGFVKEAEPKHRLRICNAYPGDVPMEIVRGRHEKLTGSVPLAYKQCRDFAAALEAGDKLEFKVADNTAGTFSVSELPASDAVLLLVVHRHDAYSTAVSFESHVFANLASAQVAVIDTYKGAASASPRIMDAPKGGEVANFSRSEALRYDSVVAVSPGVYEVELAGADGASKAKRELVALNHESYVVIRTGAEGKGGVQYPQDLIVFPQSSPAELKSGAAQIAFPGLAALLAAAATAALW